MDVEAFDDGVLLKIVAAEGATVPVNTVCAYVGQPGEAIPEAAGEAGGASGGPGPGGARVAPTQAARPAPAATPPWQRPTGPARPLRPRRPRPARRLRAGPHCPAGGRLAISPRAAGSPPRAGIDPRTITGTGPEGRIVERDVRAAMAAGGTVAAARAARRSMRPAPGPPPRAGAGRGRGGAAPAQPDAPGHRRPPHPELDVDAALHRHRRRGRHPAARAPRGAQGRRHEPDGHGLRARRDGADAGRVPGRELADRRRVGLAAPAGPPRRGRVAARRPGRPRHPRRGPTAHRRAPRPGGGAGRRRPATARSPSTT